MNIDNIIENLITLDNNRLKDYCFDMLILADESTGYIINKYRYLNESDEQLKTVIKTIITNVIANYDHNTENIKQMLTKLINKTSLSTSDIPEFN